MPAIIPCVESAGVLIGQLTDQYAQGEQTEIGGNERYVALCRTHFTEKLAMYR